jgi:hypothetical protein
MPLLYKTHGGLNGISYGSEQDERWVPLIYVFAFAERWR